MSQQDAVLSFDKFGDCSEFHVGELVLINGTKEAPGWETILVPSHETESQGEQYLKAIAAEEAGEDLEWWRSVDTPELYGHAGGTPRAVIRFRPIRLPKLCACGRPLTLAPERGLGRCSVDYHPDCEDNLAQRVNEGSAE